MVHSVHHINIIVRDLERAISTYERVLNMPVTRRDRLEERGVVAARFRIGETWLVLVQPLRDDSVPGRFLSEHGEGFFLMSLEVDSLDEEMERLGMQMFDGPVREGAENWRVADLDASLTGGAQLQFVVSGDGGGY